MRGVQVLKLRLAPLAWRLLAGTVRLAPPAPPGTPETACIYACLHRDILPAILYVRTVRPVLMVSNSPDGDILVRTLGSADYGFARGSSGPDGGRAFVNLRRSLEAGRPVGVAVDGPKGPFGSIGEGVLQLARLTGAPLVPLTARARRATVLGTWDRTVVPWPGSRVDIVQGDPLRLERGAGQDDLDRTRRRLQEFFGTED